MNKYGHYTDFRPVPAKAWFCRDCNHFLLIIYDCLFQVLNKMLIVFFFRIHLSVQTSTGKDTLWFLNLATLREHLPEQSLSCSIFEVTKKIYRLPERLAGEVTFWWFIGPWTLTVSHGNILEISTKEKWWFSMQTKGRLLWTLHKTSSGIVFCWCDVGYVKATCCSVDSRATDGHGFWQDLLRKWNLGAAIRGGGYQGAVLMSICHGNHPTWASQNG